MTWTVTVINNSGRTVVTPAAGQAYVQNNQCTVFVADLGTVTLLDIGNMGSAPYWGVRVTSAGQSQVWRYDGGGQCTLTLNANQTWTLTGQSQTLTGPIGGPIGRIFTVPTSWKIYINGVTNAYYQQRVVMTIAGGSNSYCWSASGEDNVKLCDVRTTTPSGGAAINVGVSMENSIDGSRTWRNSKISPVGQYQTMGFVERVIVSEDSVDADYNDCALVVQWWVKP